MPTLALRDAQPGVQVVYELSASYLLRRDSLISGRPAAQKRGWTLCPAPVTSHDSLATTHSLLTTNWSAGGWRPSAGAACAAPRPRSAGRAHGSRPAGGRPRRVTPGTSRPARNAA